jgi:hypothetical protein
VADRFIGGMHRAHIDTSRDLDGERIVLACFDLREDELAAARRAVAATAEERYRTPRISADDVLDLRELTALADELEHGLPEAERGDRPPGGDEVEPGPLSGDGASRGVPGVEPGQAMRTMVFSPARLSTLRDAVAAFVESRDEADWIREEDREPLALLREMLLPLEQLCAEAMRAALSPESHAR